MDLDGGEWHYTVTKTNTPHIVPLSAHAVRDPNGRAYNRTAHLAERRKMMQAWADYLDKLKSGAQIIPILKAG
jgi:hypothetical protein